MAHWHEQIGDPTVADSILDRLVHNSFRIELSGESMRKKRCSKAGGGTTVNRFLQCWSGKSDSNAVPLPDAPFPAIFKPKILDRCEYSQASSKYQRRFAPTLFTSVGTVHSHRRNPQSRSLQK